MIFGSPVWGSDDFDYPLGHIQLLGKTDGQMLKAGAPPFTPGPALEYVARHAIDFWLTTEDLSHPDNRVMADGRAGSPCTTPIGTPRATGG